ncbi:MAG: ArsR family transcriptional regulator [Spirochaetia bacterium]|nr:ArsR family transcriptional regulator [Spirochaetia bacterium]
MLSTADTRLRIVRLLLAVDSSVCVCELVDALGLSRISGHRLVIVCALDISAYRADGYERRETAPARSEGFGTSIAAAQERNMCSRTAL